MQIIGLDPSLTNFGWAVHDTEAEGLDRCLARGRFQTSAKTLFIDRYTTMRSNVIRLLEEYPQVTQIGLESPIFNEMWSEGMYGLFLYTCEALRVSKRDVVLFSPPQIKVHARDLLDRPTIGGKAWVMGKPDMVEAAQADTGGSGRWNHNEADAYWVARTAGRFWKHLDGDLLTGELSKAEVHQFRAVKTFKRGKRAGQTVQTGVLYKEDERFFRWYSGDGDKDGSKKD